MKNAGRSATLTLASKRGSATTVKLEIELDDAASPSASTTSSSPSTPAAPAPGSQRRHHRSRAKKAKANARAAQHQATRAAPTSAQQSPASGEASLPPPPSPPPPESVHVTRSISLPSPEKERGSLAGACCELQRSPIHFQREEAQTCEQEKTSYSFYDVGTQMCPACDFDMCFPILDSIDISCKCFCGRGLSISKLLLVQSHSALSEKKKIFKN